MATSIETLVVKKGAERHRIETKRGWRICLGVWKVYKGGGVVLFSSLRGRGVGLFF